MENQLTNPEQLVLLAIHPDKPQWLLSHELLAMGITGLVILGLIENKSLTLNNRKIVVRQKPSELTGIRAFVWVKINESDKNRRAKRWISRLYTKVHRKRWELIDAMQKKGLLSVSQHRFLFIPYKRVYLTNAMERQKLVTALSKKVQGSTPLSSTEASLLSIVHAIKLYKPFGATSAEHRRFKKMLKEKLTNNPVTDDVQQAIREMHAATTAATITAIAGSSAATAGQ